MHVLYGIAIKKQLVKKNVNLWTVKNQLTENISNIDCLVINKVVYVSSYIDY